MRTTSSTAMIAPELIRDGNHSHRGEIDAEARDFFALLKPRVMSLVIFTALVGMVVAKGTVNPVIAIVSLFAIAVGAGASGCLNMWWDADIDAIMSRTRTRPIPAGRMDPHTALAFGVALSVGSVIVLGLTANVLAAGLLAFTIFFYAVVYSMWLKRATPQNIVIGGAAGAFPPMIGEAVVTGHLGWDSLVLFGIIFIWTPPHFWALALVKSDDYAKAGIPMLPNVAGPDVTRTHILAYSLVLVPFALLPSIMGFGGVIYTLTSALSGVMFLILAGRVYRVRTGKAADKLAQGLFAYSILYLVLLFTALLFEHGFGFFRALPFLGLL
jgi:heme o synthase